MQKTTPYLVSGSSLAVSGELVAPNAAFFCVMQPDANFCVYEGSQNAGHGSLQWQSGGGRASDAYVLWMNTDGTLAILDGQQQPVWTAGTPQSQGSYFLAIADDGSLATYAGAPPATGAPTGATLWTSGNSSPVKSITLTAVDYDLPTATFTSAPTELYSELVTNTSGTEQTSTVTATTQTTNTSMWEDAVTEQVGVKASITTKIPFVGDGTLETSVDFSHAFKSGETVSTTKTWDLSIPVTVPAHSAIEVVALASESSVDVPYTAQLAVVLESGDQYACTAQGTFTGVSAHGLDVQFTPKTLPTPA